jgi:uncharacterized protein (DUF1697 family)
MVYVALLRGINVGGNNLIKMTALRECFEALGFGDVRTYIASGNVVFDAKGSKAALTTKIEAALSKAFAYESKLVVVSAPDLALAVREAPDGFGREPGKYRYDVIFTKPPLTPKAVLPHVETTPGVDDVAIGKHALYFRRLIAKATRSKLSKIAAKSVYRDLTIRNWNTTTKLLALATSAA